MFQGYLVEDPGWVFLAINFSL